MLKYYCLVCIVSKYCPACIYTIRQYSISDIKSRILILFSLSRSIIKLIIDSLTKSAI